MKEKRVLWYWYTIKVRKAKMIGNLLYHDSPSKSVIDGDVYGQSEEEDQG